MYDSSTISNRSQATHFVFGNDSRTNRSSYWYDFGSRRIDTQGRKVYAPPAPAQVLPAPDMQRERGKWMSSNHQDFSHYNRGISSAIYSNVQGRLADNRQWHVHGSVSIGRDRLPPFTRTSMDYRGHPVAIENQTISLIRRYLSNQRNRQAFEPRRRVPCTMVTEATCAFQWPPKKHRRPRY